VIGKELLLKGEDPETDQKTVSEIKRAVIDLHWGLEKDLPSEKDPQLSLKRCPVTGRVCPDLTNPDPGLQRDLTDQDHPTENESRLCTIRLCLRR